MEIGAKYQQLTCQNCPQSVSCPQSRFPLRTHSDPWRRSHWTDPTFPYWHQHVSHYCCILIVDTSSKFTQWQCKWLSRSIKTLSPWYGLEGESMFSRDEQIWGFLAFFCQRIIYHHHNKKTEICRSISLSAKLNQVETTEVEFNFVRPELKESKYLTLLFKSCD